MQPLTFLPPMCIIRENFIGQFVTILSVNKTRDFRWALCAHFLLVWSWTAPNFFLEEHHVEKYQISDPCRRHCGAVRCADTPAECSASRFHHMGDPNAAVRSAVCAFLFHPGSDSRIDGGLPGFQHHLRAALPLDFLVGSLATLLAAGGWADPAGHGEGLSSGWDGDARTVQRTAGRLGTDGIHRRRFSSSTRCTWRWESWRCS